MRGLKQYYACKWIQHSSRTPPGVRGLKLLHRGKVVRLTKSHPARGAWIETDRDPDQNDNRGEGGKGFDLATILDTIEGASEISDLSDLYDEYSKKIQGEELQKFKDALSKKRIELQAKK